MSSDMLMRYFLANQVAKGSHAPKKDVAKIAVLSGMMPSMPLSILVARSMAQGAAERYEEREFEEQPRSGSYRSVAKTNRGEDPDM